MSSLSDEQPLPRAGEIWTNDEKNIKITYVEHIVFDTRIRIYYYEIGQGATKTLWWADFQRQFHRNPLRSRSPAFDETERKPEKGDFWVDKKLTIKEEIEKDGIVYVEDIIDNKTIFYREIKRNGQVFTCTMSKKILMEEFLKGFGYYNCKQRERESYLNIIKKKKKEEEEEKKKNALAMKIKEANISKKRRIEKREKRSGQTTCMLCGETFSILGHDEDDIENNEEVKEINEKIKKLDNEIKNSHRASLSMQLNTARENNNNGEIKRIEEEIKNLPKVDYAKIFREKFKLQQEKTKTIEKIKDKKTKSKTKTISNQTYIKLPRCGHIFHRKCIDKYITRVGRPQFSSANKKPKHCIPINMYTMHEFNYIQTYFNEKNPDYIQDRNVVLRYAGNPSEEAVEEFFDLNKIYERFTGKWDKKENVAGPKHMYCKCFIVDDYYFQNVGRHVEIKCPVCKEWNFWASKTLTPSLSISRKGSYNLEGVPSYATPIMVNTEDGPVLKMFDKLKLKF